MRRHLTLPFAVGVAILSFAAYGQMGMMGGNMNMSMRRHHYAMMNGIDSHYATTRNPLPDKPENLAAGKALYDQNCATCHGTGGLGDGPAGRNLNPHPANIAAFARMPMATDGYLDWTISEGGVPVGSAMPPFKDTLKDGDIWKIILYVRSL